LRPRRARSRRPPPRRLYAPRATDQRRQRLAALLRLVRCQRHGRPPTGRTGQKQLHFLQQHYSLAVLPIVDGSAPFGIAEPHHLGHALLVEQRQEQPLALSVCRSVQALHTALPEKGLLQHPRSGMGTLQTTIIVKEPSGVLASHADGVLHQQAHPEHIASESLAPVADEVVTF